MAETKAEIWSNPASAQVERKQEEANIPPNFHHGLNSEDDVPEKNVSTENKLLREENEQMEVENIAIKSVSKKQHKLTPNLRDRANWLIYKLYVSEETEKCCRVIENQLKLCNDMSEYPFFIKALIKRKEGEVDEALDLFQKAARLNPQNIANHKQIGRCLFLLTKHRAAIDVYEEALSLSPNDWELFHNKGICHMYINEYENAIDCFQEANSIERHDITYIELGKAYTLQEKYKDAVDVYLDAVEFSPENSELLTTLGLLYMRTEEGLLAFDYLGNSLTLDPSNPKTVLAAASMIQEKGDIDVALNKYRVAAVHTPNSAQLWNNIGMCFFTKRRYVAAVACLKRALTLEPLEWLISHNLGLVYLNACQYASAFNYFSASMNLKPDYAPSYMYLAVTLSRLDDFETAFSAYEKAIELSPANHTFYLNYAVTLFNSGEFGRAKEQLDIYSNLIDNLDAKMKSKIDQELVSMGNTLAKALESF